MSHAIRRKKSSNNSQHGGSGSGSNKRTKTIDLGWTGKKRSNDGDDDHIDSDSEVEGRNKEPSLKDEDVEEEETLDAKKVRLAREYLRKLEADEDDDDDSENGSSSSSEDDDNEDEEDEHERIGLKLQRERLKREGTLERAVADRIDKNITSMTAAIAASNHRSVTEQSQQQQQQDAKDWIQSGHIQLLKGHDLTPTCVALQSNGERAISASKDHSVILWDVERAQCAVTLAETWKKQEPSSSKAKNQYRTMGEVLSVACSDDGRYAAIGKRDATVCIYDVRAGGGHEKNKLIKTFTGHKGPVTCLAFRTQSLQLFSGSDDRCIRHYNLSEQIYVETLYGHQFGVSGIDCHRKERPISVGRDRTARAWKLTEDTHLIFRGGSKTSSADCISVIKDDWFLTGHDDGHLSLWMTEKKKAVVTIDCAHGVDSGSGVGRGIVSLASLQGSDVAVTGSYDGYLRFWKASTGSTLSLRGMHSLNQIPLQGFVNGVAMGPKGRFCVVAVGQEPRLGRWNRVPKAKNRFGIVRLRSSDDDDGGGSSDDNSEQEGEILDDDNVVSGEEESSSDSSDSDE